VEAKEGEVSDGFALAVTSAGAAADQAIACEMDNVGLLQEQGEGTAEEGGREGEREAKTSEDAAREAAAARRGILVSPLYPAILHLSSLDWCVLWHKCALKLLAFPQHRTLLPSLSSSSFQIIFIFPFFCNIIFPFFCSNVHLLHIMEGFALWPIMIGHIVAHHDGRGPSWVRIVAHECPCHGY